MSREDSTAREEWRPIPGYEGYYEASSLGRIRSLDRTVRCVRGGRAVSWLHQGRILKTRPVNGYRYVTLSVEATQVSIGVHILVCSAFHGPRPEGRECAHWDGRPSNNRPENLRWATHTENFADMRRHGTVAKGSRHGMAKLTEQQVIEIYQARGTHRAIAEQYGVCRGAVSQIKRGKNWGHVTSKI